ncbi:MAG: hypothetical protein LC774_03835 [Acidobacteria bacterium]|nr:hypothetical protein [Acidobacteriota bacterium]
MLHIPLLRKGKEYKSLDAVRVAHHRTREPFVEISQANVGLVRRDLNEQESARRTLAAFTTDELIALSERAAKIFAGDELPVGDAAQTPEDYVAQVSATTCLPFVMARRNMEKVRGVMAEMRTVLNGLTRNLPFDALDRGYGEVAGQTVSFFPRALSLGVVLPSNSPGVHTLWTPSVALKTPLVLKPGGAEPWTPYRVAQAFIKAGAPREAFSYYPTSHAGAGEILLRTGRGMVFGDAGSTSQWRDDARVEVHGPGYSKIVFGEDCADDWEKYLDVIAASVLDNGGRSCVNASGVWTPAHAPFASVVKVKSDELPEALGASLVVTALTNDEDLIGKLLSSPFVDRLNVGALQTNQLCWDQPHEGNLFEHLYARRAFQRAAVA